MNTQPRPRVCFRAWLCFFAMVAVAAPMLWGLGLSPLTVILAVIAIGCLVAMFYAWWLGKQVLKPLDRVGRTDTGKTP